ncbi:MAG TPA: metallophosphoesterase [Polyangiaceae bacterium]|nr:metallophosphoesterase [Polyangiaceae bacterium]
MARSIFIGDVHGCARELADLLDRVGPTGGDSVYFVGDLVARGPDTPGVLRLFREVGAMGVVGNHEARLLDVRRARRAGEPTTKMGPTHEALLASLPESDWALLEALPLYMKIDEHQVLLVHAGLVPGVPPERQDPWTLTHIRSLDGGAPSAQPGNESWSADYSGPLHVIFGHDARRGLQLRAHATGLDTACVYGEQLSALVVPSGQSLPPPGERRDLVVSTPAYAAYYGVNAARSEALNGRSPPEARTRDR